MSKQMLLDLARTYVMLAKVMPKQYGKHYLLMARKCLNEYRLLKQNEATLTLFLRVA